MSRIRCAFIVSIGVFVLGLGMPAAAQEKVPGTVVLKGSPMGGVKFDHAAHAKAAKDKCETCHHAAKPEKAAKSAHQACSECHTKAAAAPMKTTAKLAMHDNMAKAGLCIDCHKTNAKAPAKCPDCHKKENA